MTQCNGNGERIPSRQVGRISDADWDRIQKARREYEESLRGASCRPYPSAFGYRRCSHQDSADSGLGLDAQERIIQGYFEMLRGEIPDLQWGGGFADEVVSAYRGKNYRFPDRPGGCAILDSAQEGDHVIVARFDRAFRNTADCLRTADLLKEWGIRLHICDLRIDTATAMGRFALTILAASAELESGWKSERTKAALAELRRRGQPTNGACRPMGFQWKGERGRRHLVPDPYERSIMGEIVRLRDNERLSWTIISDRIEQRLAEMEKRAPAKEGWGRKWPKSRVRRAYQLEKVYRSGAVTTTVPDALRVSSAPEAAGQPTL
jgi:DNA invertase Pin-like site-specific DNA recombinase